MIRFEVLTTVSTVVRDAANATAERKYEIAEAIARGLTEDYESKEDFVKNSFTGDVTVEIWMLGHPGWPSGLCLQEVEW